MQADWDSAGYLTGGYEIKINSEDPTYEHRISQIWLLSDPDTTSMEITGLVSHNGDIYAMTDSDHAFWHMDDDQCQVSYSSSDNYGKFVTEGQGYYFTCPTDTSVAFSTDLENNDFTTADELKLGPTNEVITGLAFGMNRLLVGTSNNVYNNVIYPEGGVEYNEMNAYGVYGFSTEEISATWNSLSNSDNFRNMKAIDGDVYLPHTKGLWVLNGGNLTNISPYLRMRDYTAFHGSVMAICAGRDWTYFIAEPVSGNNSKIFAVRPEGGTYIMHTLGEVDLDDISDCIVFDDKLYIQGCDSDGNTEIHYFSLADDAFPDLAGKGLRAYYKVDGGSWTEVGADGTITASGKLSFTAGTTGYKIQIGLADENSNKNPDSSAYAWVTGWEDFGLPAEKKVFGSLIIVGDTLTDTAVSTTFTVTGVQINASQDISDNPERVFDLKVLIGDNIPHGGVTTNNQSAKKLRDAIHTARDSSTATLTDVWGDTHTVRITSVDEQFANGFSDKRYVPSVIHLVMEEVT